MLIFYGVQVWYISHYLRGFIHPKRWLGMGFVPTLSTWIRLGRSEELLGSNRQARPWTKVLATGCYLDFGANDPFPSYLNKNQYIIIHNVIIKIEICFHFNVMIHFRYGNFDWFFLLIYCPATSEFYRTSSGRTDECSGGPWKVPWWKEWNGGGSL